MPTIMTKYLGPTNHRGSRISAKDGSGRNIIINYDDDLESTANHIAAVKAWIVKHYPKDHVSKIEIITSDFGYQLVHILRFHY